MPDAIRQQVRGLLRENGQFPSRRTWERRLAKLPAHLPAKLPAHLPGLIGYLGRHLVELIQPWVQAGRGVAMDSTALKIEDRWRCVAQETARAR